EGRDINVILIHRGQGGTREFSRMVRPGSCAPSGQLPQEVPVTRGTLSTLAVFTILACASGAAAQSPSVLYTWEGTGDARMWAKNFGDNEVTIENTIAGELTITETRTEGT